MNTTQIYKLGLYLVILHITAHVFGMTLDEHDNHCYSELIKRDNQATPPPNRGPIEQYVNNPKFDYILSSSTSGQTKQTVQETTKKEILQYARSVNLVTSPNNLAHATLYLSKARKLYSEDEEHCSLLPKFIINLIEKGPNNDRENNILSQIGITAGPTRFISHDQTFSYRLCSSTRPQGLVINLDQPLLEKYVQYEDNPQNVTTLLSATHNYAVEKNVQVYLRIVNVDENYSSQEATLLMLNTIKKALETKLFPRISTIVFCKFDDNSSDKTVIYNTTIFFSKKEQPEDLLPEKFTGLLVVANSPIYSSRYGKNNPSFINSLHNPEINFDFQENITGLVGAFEALDDITSPSYTQLYENSQSISQSYGHIKQDVYKAKSILQSTLYPINPFISFKERNEQLTNNINKLTQKITNYETELNKQISTIEATLPTLDRSFYDRKKLLIKQGMALQILAAVEEMKQHASQLIEEIKRIQQNEISEILPAAKKRFLQYVGGFSVLLGLITYYCYKT